MKIKRTILLTLFAFISISLSAQNQKSSNSTTSKKRSVAAKLLVELDKTPTTNNNNNGRSNKDRCCDDEIIAPQNYDVLAFGLTTSWYLWDEAAGDVGIPNPIPYIQSLGSNWEISLYNGDGEHLSRKSAYVQDNEMLISIDGLNNGKYFIEIEVDNDFYSTGFSVGTVPLPPASSVIKKKN